MREKGGRAYSGLAVNDNGAVVFVVHHLFELLSAVHRVLVFAQADCLVVILVELAEHCSCAHGIQLVLHSLGWFLWNETFVCQVLPETGSSVVLLGKLAFAPATTAPAPTASLLVLVVLSAVLVTATARSFVAAILVLVVILVSVLVVILVSVLVTFVPRWLVTFSEIAEGIGNLIPLIFELARREDPVVVNVEGFEFGRVLRLQILWNLGHGAFMVLVVELLCPLAFVLPFVVLLFLRIAFLL